jgi:hypothetical protein
VYLSIRAAGSLQTTADALHAPLNWNLGARTDSKGANTCKCLNKEFKRLLLMQQQAGKPMGRHEYTVKAAHFETWPGSRTLLGEAVLTGMIG